MNIVVAFPVTSAAAKLNRSNLAEWFDTNDVLRVSLGNFLFFSILSLLMVGVKNQKDPRDSLHHGGWMMKIICWCLMVIFMFFLPNEIISFYGKSIS
ncbi:putative serine incorporator/TMS membrane protein [Helianthus anomalus]